MRGQARHRPEGQGIARTCLEYKRTMTVHVRGDPAYVCAGIPSRDGLGQSNQRYVGILLIPEICPGGQRQRLTVNISTLLV